MIIMQTDMSKHHLIDSIVAGYEEFRLLLAGLGSDELTCPGVAGPWSIKDLLAHVAAHELRMIEWTAARLAGIAPSGPQPYAMPDPVLRPLNDAIYRENRTRPLEQVLAEFEAAHRWALTLVRAAREADLIDPQRYPLEGGQALWEAVAANTFDHYEEHGRDIRNWRATRSDR